jgi:hypothetical protein
LDDLVEITYKAADELSEAQTASIIEQLYGDGFEWGLSMDVDITSPKEPVPWLRHWRLQMPSNGWQLVERNWILSKTLRSFG